MDAVIRYLFSSALVLFLASQDLSATCYAQEDASSLVAQITNLPIKIKIASPKGRWLKIQKEGQIIFKQIVKRVDFREGLTTLVESFGKDANSDLAIIVSCPQAFLPTRAMKPLSSFIVDDTTEDIRRRSKAELIVAKQQVISFVGEKDLLMRYYRALVWSRLYFGKPYSHQFTLVSVKAQELSKHFPSSKVDSYWWYARELLILLVATNRLDMLKGVEPTELKVVFNKWVEWFDQKKNHMELVAEGIYWVAQKNEVKTAKALDIPEVPFLGQKKSEVWSKLPALLLEVTLF